MVYSTTKTNIDEIIDEIVEDGGRGLEVRGGEFKECPVCHHIVPSSADFCPYCFEVFNDEVDVKNLTLKLLDRVNELSKIATLRDIYIPNLIENIKNANKKIKMGEIKKAHKILQNNYLELVRRVSISMLDEAGRYKILLGLDPANKRVFKKLENFVDEWNFKEAMDELENIRRKYDEFSRDLQYFLEELERVEMAAEIAEDLGIDTSKALEIIDSAKDEADRRNYKGALKILENTFVPLKNEIEVAMKEILRDVENKKGNLEEDSEKRKLVRLLQELKFYWSKGNYISVIERLGEINREF